MPKTFHFIVPSSSTSLFAPFFYIYMFCNLYCGKLLLHVFFSCKGFHILYCLILHNVLYISNTYIEHKKRSLKTFYYLVKLRESIMRFGIKLLFFILLCIIPKRRRRIVIFEISGFFVNSHHRGNF